LEARLIAGLVSNVTPKEPMQKGIILACFQNSKLLIFEYFNNHNYPNNRMNPTAKAAIEIPIVT